jgi:threonine dehydrogenase-like Zn-dependent dehydrogenase
MGVIVEPHRAEMHSEPLGKMGPEDVAIRMLACNICTTDYQQWDGLRNHMGFPMAAGHECCGDIIAAGEKVSAYQVGDRVSFGGGMGCGVCEYCRTGRGAMCTMPKGPHPMVNGYRGGRGFSDYRIVPQNNLIKMNKELDPAICAFLEPVSAAVGGAVKLRIRPGENIVVIGVGTMGMLNAMVAHAFGARVIISEVSDKKLERARSLGYADVIDARVEDPVARVKELTDGVGADGVIPSVGNSKVYAQALEMLRQSDGRLLLFAAGYPAPELTIDPNKIHYGRTEIIGSIGCNAEEVFLAAKLINFGQVDPRVCWEGATYPLRDIQKAYEHAVKPDMYRITVDLQGV